LSQLPELPVLADIRGGKVREIGRRATGIYRFGGAGSGERLAQPDVIDPKLGFSNRDRRGHAEDARRQLLDCREVGWVYTRTQDLDQVGPVAGDIGAYVLQSAGGGPGRRVAPEPGVLDDGAKLTP